MTTAEWIARIEAVRFVDGFDGPTWSGQPILTRIIVHADRTECVACSRPLTKHHRHQRARHCSRACYGRAQAGVPKMRRSA